MSSIKVFEIKSILAAELVKIGSVAAFALLVSVQYWPILSPFLSLIALV